MPRTFRRLLTLALLAFTAVGCSTSENTARPKVQGHVTYKGQPVTSRTLTLVFDAPAGESFSQMFPLGPDGAFEGELPQPGTYKVVLNPSLAVLEGAAPQPAAATKLPAKYNAAATTDLNWEIKTGPNQRDFELKD